MNKKLRNFALLAFIVLPTMLFAQGQGNVIGYAGGWTAPPTAAQLDRVTHIMLMEWRANADGTLRNLYPHSGQVGGWLRSFVAAAHAKNVKVSMVISGNNTNSSIHIATQDANRANFVANIVNFVMANNLDGVDIDWEFPRGDTEWKQCMSLLEDLRAAMPDKRISIAIGADSPEPQFNNHFNMTDRSIVQERIWNAVDAIHLMTYGMQGVTRPVRWHTHADVTASKATMDRWADFGYGQPGFCRTKLIMGCAFYGLTTATALPGIPYRDGGGVGCDTPETLKQKVDYCFDNGFGGVMIWELSYDKNIHTTPDLLSAVWDATQARIGASNIVEQPTIAATQIYPNPAAAKLYVIRATQEPADYTIYNSTGQIVLQGILQANAPINVSSLSNGVYFMKVSGETLKVIIAK